MCKNSEGGLPRLQVSFLMHSARGRHQIPPTDRHQEMVRQTPRCWQETTTQPLQMMRPAVLEKQKHSRSIQSIPEQSCATGACDLSLGRQTVDWLGNTTRMSDNTATVHEVSMLEESRNAARNKSQTRRSSELHEELKQAARELKQSRTRSEAEVMPLE